MSSRISSSVASPVGHVPWAQVTCLTRLASLTYLHVVQVRQDPLVAVTIHEEENLADGHNYDGPGNNVGVDEDEHEVTSSGAKGEANEEEGEGGGGYNRSLVVSQLSTFLVWSARTAKNLMG